jgi:hypothetical protein
MLTGAVRGLLVSPWFAAGAGFLIATAAFIVAPRGELEFPNNAIKVTHCSQAACQATTSQGIVPLTEPSEQIKVATATATSGLTVDYYVLWQQRGAFSMEITLTGKRASGPWQLDFVIPGGFITSVEGATWQRSGLDGVAAHGSSTAAGGGSRDGQGGDAGDGSSQFDADSGDVRLIVTGDGTASPPAGCLYNGTQCRFIRSS